MTHRANELFSIHDFPPIEMLAPRELHFQVFMPNPENSLFLLYRLSPGTNGFLQLRCSWRCLSFGLLALSGYEPDNTFL